ncbi:hypothetical protein PRIPAC_90858 [Pristionchus pacificus]|uniref:Uncharacterized protein n=1 Tax=Pristionchus pacificus TaxID=54126 RepID=A0A2A6CXE2_PRIPA|nr:hypothetical protein PRIPAC_90858 [Pristionchus pacificus]|eukprot:PDM82727.1 hypothetical protein PRIPAC_37120 [Pristionchus pacificus]
MLMLKYVFGHNEHSHIRRLFALRAATRPKEFSVPAKLVMQLDVVEAYPKKSFKLLPLAAEAAGLLQTPNRLTKGGPRQYDAPRKWGTREIWGDEDERERREAINRLGEERSEGQQINDLRPAGRREDKEGRTDASNTRDARC